MNTKNVNSTIDSDMIRVMLQQESKYYLVEDYQSYQNKAMIEFQCKHPAQMLDPIDDSCRSKMLAWFQQICDFCQYDADETIIIMENALNYMDRYVTTEHGCVALLDRNYYQCMSIACLYMSMKIHASAAICASDMSQITRNTYSSQQIQDMEYDILQSLNWYVNPPTVSVFVGEYVKIIMDEIASSNTVVDANVLKSVLKLVRIQTNTALQNDSFKTIPASIIAYCAIYNAIQLLFVPQQSISIDLIQKVMESFGNVLPASSDTILMIQKILCDVLIETKSLPTNYSLQQQHMPTAATTIACGTKSYTSANKAVIDQHSPRIATVVTMSTR